MSTAFPSKASDSNTFGKVLRRIRRTVQRQSTAREAHEAPRFEPPRRGTIVALLRVPPSPICPQSVHGRARHARDTPPMKFMMFGKYELGHHFLQKVIEAKLRPALVCTDDPFFAEDPRAWVRALKRLAKRARLAFQRGRRKQYATFFLARAHGIPTWPAREVNSTAFGARIRELETDYVFVFNFTLIEPEIFEAPRLGCINLHLSYLPRHRGIDPMFWSILCGDETAGVTFAAIDRGVDDGRIIEQYEIRTSPFENAEELALRLTTMGVRLFVHLIWRLRLGESLPEGREPAGGSTVDRRPSKEDSVIRSSMATDDVLRLIRALPGKALLVHEEREYKVLHGLPLGEDGALGAGRETIRRDELGNFYVRATDGRVLYLVTASP